MITHHVSLSGYGVEQHDSAEIRAAIFAVEKAIAQSETMEFNTEHMFVPNLYFRRLDLPAGSINTGKLHAQDDGLIIAKGKVTFITEHGPRTFVGPCMTTVKANTKPLVYAHEDTVMFSAHLNLDNTQDLALIESRVVIPNELGYEPKEVLS